MNKIAFVIATKDRPKDICRLMANLMEQSRHPDQLIIVDASENSVVKALVPFDQLDIEYSLFTGIASASGQRNAGIKMVRPDIDIIGFLDDDIVLKPGALQLMQEFWMSAPDDWGGAAFYLQNFEPDELAIFKRLPIVEWLGLYSGKKGLVMPSGWQTMARGLEKTTYVQWLPSTASLWRREIFLRHSFEEFFSGYSYLEDLDFSYSVSKNYRLAIVAQAGFYHYHSPSGRVSHYHFGKVEVRNRLFIVKKHKLSIPRCYFAIIIRLLITLGMALRKGKASYMQRFMGNFVALLRSFR